MPSLRGIFQHVAKCFMFFQTKNMEQFAECSVPCVPQCCDFFLNRRIEISKLAAPFSRIAPVRLFRTSIHDFFGLNTEPTNHAVGGSHLYPVRHAKKAEQNALFGRKKYSQPNSRIETCRRFDYLKI